ncbi:MAG: hypothetical protein GY719_39670 [bacterium]|nr:hypothetical protein [bacterium]
MPFVALLLIFLAGVSSGLAVPIGPPPGEPEPPGEGASPALGALAGRVRLAGDALPGPTPVENTTDPADCGQGHTLEDLLVSAESRGIGNVILSLSGVPASEVPPVEPRRLVLDNVGCRFVPHAGVLTVGSSIEAINNDSFLHTAHLYGAAEMNIALPHHGSRGARIARVPGVIVVKCAVAIPTGRRP